MDLCLPWTTQADEERREQGLKCTVSHAERILASTDGQWSEIQPDPLPLVACFITYVNYDMFQLMEIMKHKELDLKCQHAHTSKIQLTSVNLSV